VVAHYRPPVPTTGIHLAILFQTSASEEKLSFGGEFLSATDSGVSGSEAGGTAEMFAVH
jgi:hypothetical protein